MLIVLLGGDAAAPLIRLAEGGGGVQRGNRKENETGKTGRGKLNGKEGGELCVMISHISTANPARRAEESLQPSAGRGGAFRGP